MKSVCKHLLILFSFVILFSCNKEKNSYDFFVYSSKKDEYTTLNLNIHDNNKGQVPYFTQKLYFDNDSLLARALTIRLGPQNYPIIIKDQYGNIKVDGKLKVKRNSISSSDVIGELHTLVKGHKVIMEIVYN